MTRLSSVRAYARAHRFASWLILIALAGLALRIGVDLGLRHRRIGGDGFRYHFGALFLADGQGFRNLFNPGVPDTGHPPAWTILLAGPTKLGLRTWLSHQIVTSFVGTATIVMVGVAARSAFGKGVGLIAAALAAVYPFFWIYEREVVSEPLAMFFIATLIWLAYKFIASPSAGLAIALGAVVGLLAMTKSDQLAIAFLLVAPLIASRREIERRRRFDWLVLAAVVCLAIMAPWSIYMSHRFHRTVLLTGSVGGAMAAGNCAQTYSGERLGYYVTICARGNIKPGDPFNVDNQLRHRAIEFMRSHERRTPVVMAARVGRTFGFFRPFQQMGLETERGTPKWVFRIAFFMYWALLPLAVAGAVIARRRDVPIYPFLVFPALAVFTVLLTIGSVRYRAPAEVPLIMLAAVALDALFGVARHRATRTIA
jgi:4-amino-4-deoxy-L-arabinose transferase-like glycosyltransferase